MSRPIKIAAVLWIVALAVTALLVTPRGVLSGSLEPSAPPGPTMHTLDDIYNKLESLATSGQATMPTEGDVTGIGLIHMGILGPGETPIEGSCTVREREGTIVVVNFGHEVVSPRDAASGIPTGQHRHEPVIITKHFDKSSPLLYQSLIRGDVLEEVTFNFYRINAEQQEEQYYTIKLEDVIISRIRPSYVHMEEVSFVYQKITWNWIEGGIETTADWEYTPEDTP